MSDAAPTLWLLRHGETPWSLSGQHTGRTDIALTPRGEKQAGALRQHLGGRPFALVLTSPLRRASDTCRLAGYGEVAVSEPNSQEWDYGKYEGKTTAEIRAALLSWSIWKDGASGGESVSDVGRRADRVIERVQSVGGDVALFAHGHFLRVLAARWLDLPPSTGGSLALDTASVSVLGFESERRVIRHWNEICHLEGAP